MERAERVERQDDTEAWKELGCQLVLEHDLVSPASFAAMPRLAPGTAKARTLAGKIMERAAGRHGCDDLPADCAGVIAEFREVLDRHLRSRPAEYLVSFRACSQSKRNTSGRMSWRASRTTSITWTVPLRGLTDMRSRLTPPPSPELTSPGRPNNPAAAAPEPASLDAQEPSCTVAAAVHVPVAGCQG